MAFSSGKYPPVRLSDIDGLVPENVLDSSSGNKLIEYIRNQDGKSRRPRLNVLFDDDDNQIRFAFDKLQVPANPKSPSAIPPASARNSDENADEMVATEAPAVPSAVITVMQNENRLPSFLSPRRNTDSGQQRMQSPSIAGAISPGRGSPFRPRVQSSRLASDLNRLALLKECQRANDLKCEKLRQMASSTPLIGHNHQDQLGKSFMSLSKSISPISELSPTEPVGPDRQAMEPGARSSPQRHPPTPAPASATPQRRSPSPAPASPQRRTSCLVPATQDQADGTPAQRNDVLSSPPRAEQVFLIPETPSPVRRSDQPISTPLSGLRLSRRSSSPRTAVRRMLMGEGTDDVCSTPRRSILKRECDSASDSSSKHVSFAEHLTKVRHMSPAYVRSPASSDITSDESEEEERCDAVDMISNKSEKRSVTSIAANARKTLDKVQPAKSYVQEAVEVRAQEQERQEKGSDREEESRANMVQSPDPSRPRIETDDNRSLHGRIASPASAEPPESSIVQRSQKDAATARSPESRRSFESTRAANRTNRNTINMIMEDWDEDETPRTNAGVQLVAEGRAQRSTSPNTEPVPITNIDTPRPILHEIFEPPSAFCDETDANPRPSVVAEPANGQSPTNHLVPPTREGESSSGVSSDGSVVTAEAEDNGAVASVPFNAAVRIMSANSPHDHVSMNLLAAVDEIHFSQSSQLAVGPNRTSQDGERRTLVVPRKRSTLAMVNPEAVSYFKAVEKTCGVKRPKKVKTGKKRRKLFIKQMTTDGMEDGKDEEPVELPPSPELEQAPEPEPVPPAITSVSSPAIICPPVAVCLQRLSDGTLERMIGKRPIATTGKELPVDPKPSPTLLLASPPVTEKQNVESPEKTSLPSKPKRTKTAKVEPRKKKERADKTRNLKELKDVANGIRQQVEGTGNGDEPTVAVPEEGVRRSHRNRRLAKDVLKRNPIMIQSDMPNYRDPTLGDVLRYYRETGMATEKPRAPKATRKAAKTTERQQPVEPEAVQPKKRGRKPKQKQQTAVNEFDRDGFRIPQPPAPSSPSPSTSSTASSSTNPGGKERPQPPSSSTLLSHMGGSPNGFSLDSGLSSAGYVSHTGDEMDHPKAAKSAPRTQDAALPSTSKTTKCYNVSLQEGCTDEDIMAEKRLVLDWMMFLTKSQQERPINTPAPEKHGFRHFSVEHLMFDRSGDIEYSFYSFSVTDNFGFIRMLPNAKKKMSRAKGCILRFLILNGTAMFTINNIEAKAVGGDFFVLPAGSRYQIQNASETSLMFMMKSAVPTE